MNELDTRCVSCGSLLDEEDLFCANCGTESPAREAAASPPAADASRIARCNFECRGCGASMSYDAGAKALRCPFCGSVELAAQEDRKILAPKYVVPFAVERGAAETSMRQWLGRGFWRPKGLAESAQVVGMTPVYVPYWIFQAKIHAHWTADSSRTPPGASGDWYPLAGERESSYAGLLIGASGALTPSETHRLCPFDLARGVPPGEVDLENVTVEEFSLSKKYARPLARAALERLETDACAATCVPGSARNVRVNLQITEMTGEPALLPVWIMAYRFRDRVFRFLVNGQTGKATGEAPISYGKIAAAILIAALIVAIVLLLAGVLKADLPAARSASLQISRIASSSPNPVGQPGPGSLAQYQFFPSTGTASVRLPGICRYPAGSFSRTHFEAYRSHAPRSGRGIRANQEISS
ncbi:MAG: zinc ribbon domain-containing protein [Pirellulales bacterium]|nr:zinc ribbon domain-containing protein [Pirellulales bacterium]